MSELKLHCGCQPIDAIVCDRASRLMDQIHIARRQEANEPNYRGLEKAKRWLGKHYEENEVER